MEMDSNSIVSNRLSLSLSCFFCLRSNSNSRKYLNPLAESNSYGDGEDDVSSFQEFSLRNLYRYLNLLHSDKEEKDFNDLKMPICEKCFKLNGEFDKLYNLLEETKLRLNWCVKKMQDVITISRNKCRLPTATQMEMMEKEEEDVDEEKVLDIWRTHTLDRMKEVTCTSFPQVLVYKKSTKRSQFASNDCPESIGEVEATAKRLRTQDEKDKSLTLEEETLAPQQTITRTLSLPSSSSSSLLVDRVIEDKEVENTACNNIHANGKISKEGSAAQTEIKSRSPLRGKRRGKPALISNIVPVSNSIRMRAQFRCKACKTMINCMKAFEHWEHHCPAKGAQQPLISAIKKPSAKTRGAPRIKCSSKSSNCPYCSFKSSTSASFSMERHIVRFHPEHYLIDEKDKEIGLWHERFRSILSYMVYPHFIVIAGSHRSCTSCGTTYKCNMANENIIMIKRHLIFHHKAELKEKLKVVLEDPSLEEKLDKSCNQKRGKLSSSCTYCSFKSDSSRKGAMVSHLVRFHPEHYVIDENDRASGLWHEQFQTILGNMVYPNFITKVGRHRSCSSCGVIYKSGNVGDNIFMVKKHLIFHHRAELKENLKVVLEDPSLEEKLNDLNEEAATKRIRCKPATAGNNYSSNCSYCPYKTFSRVGASSTSGTMVAHLIRFHPEHFLIDEKDKASGLWHEHFRTVLNEMVYPSFISSVGHGHRHHRSCSSCGIVYKSARAIGNVVMMRRHLLFNHQTELKEKLKVVLGDPSLEEKLLLKSKNKALRQNRISVRKHLIFNHKDFLKNELKNLDSGEKKEMRANTVGEQQKNVDCVASTSRESQKNDVNYFAKCAYCRYECDSPNILALSMENHLVRFHPEHFLMEEDKSISKHPEFQRILSDMIFPKFLLNTGQQTQCSLCNMKYTVGKRHENVVLLKKHLVLQHSSELKKSIKGVMEDPTLEEKLDSCSADGVTCSCGVYFAPLEQQARRFHEKFHCIRNTEQSQEEKVQCSPHANKEMERKQMKFEERRSTVIFGLGEVDLLELD